MARDEKPLRLRPVDEPGMEPLPVVRLGTPETPKRLVLDVEPVRLPVPDREEGDLRTYQPSIDVLTDTAHPTIDLDEDSWGEAVASRNPVPWGWFALMGVAITGAVLWSLGSVEKADETQGRRIRTETETALMKEERELREAALLVDRIDAVVRAFVNATSVDALSTMVRQSERVTPLMRAYYSGNPLSPSRAKFIKAMQPVTLDGRGNFWLASAVLANGRLANLILEITESGDPLVDWETSVCHQPMSWDDFSLQRPTGQSYDFRVYAERDTFYSHEFADANQWLCFRLTTLDAEETLFGYVRAGSEEAAELLEQFGENAGNRVSLILRLGIPAGLKSRRGVVIEKLISSRWIYLDPPDSGS